MYISIPSIWNVRVVKKVLSFNELEHVATPSNTDHDSRNSESPTRKWSGSVQWAPEVSTSLEVTRALISNNSWTCLTSGGTSRPHCDTIITHAFPALLPSPQVLTLRDGPFLVLHDQRPTKGGHSTASPEQSCICVLAVFRNFTLSVSLFWAATATLLSREIQIILLFWSQFSLMFLIKWREARVEGGVDVIERRLSEA